MIKLKELLGFCGIKGCPNRSFCTVTVRGKRKDTGEDIVAGKRKLCPFHFAMVYINTEVDENE